VIGSADVHARRAVSATPSPFGEKAGGATDWIAGAVRSTRTVHVRLARLPAASAAIAWTRYVPSGTTAPALLRPVQVTVAVPPAPDRMRTGAPTRVPPTGATPTAQPVAPAATSDTFTDSRVPSPFGGEEAARDRGRPDGRRDRIDRDAVRARLAAWNPNAGL
jgi:hypothetical protein